MVSGKKSFLFSYINPNPLSFLGVWRSQAEKLEIKRAKVRLRKNPEIQEEAGKGREKNLATCYGGVYSSMVFY